MLHGQKKAGIGTTICQRALRALSRKNKKSLTLIEIMVVVFIMGIIFMALFLSLTTAEFSSSVSSAKTDLQAKLRLVMDLIIRDVRQTSSSEGRIDFSNPPPSESYIKFVKVTGVDNVTPQIYTLTSDYIEYNYTAALNQLSRNEVNDSGSIIKSWNFTNLTQVSFYTAPGVPLAQGEIAESRKLLVNITGQTQVRNSLVINQTLSEEVKIRND
ncbi:MAG: prepilin-type N-terminal cleavage/methylation domain-containing protein [Candidatus Omnitrophica bacterium]|nr:prepilin-type N-terminal cleavage/methylation domain-containing protein [Candidatus Omnitrophota bacterium]